MNQARSITAADFAPDCPVPLDVLGQLLRAGPEAFADLVIAIPEPTRARLALWLYGRSHTHALGVRVAAACEGTSLRRAGGLIGNQLHDLSRRPYEAPNHGATARTAARRISLGGTRAVA